MLHKTRLVIKYLPKAVKGLLILKEGGSAIFYVSLAVKNPLNDINGDSQGQEWFLLTFFSFFTSANRT